MASFKDIGGNSWDVTIPIDLARKLRTNHAIDVLDTEFSHRFAIDIFLQFDLLVAACEDQMKARAITKQAFDSSLSAVTVYESALTAMREALIDFYRRAGRSDLVRMAEVVTIAAAKLQRSAAERAGGEEAKQALKDHLDRLEVEVDREMDKAIHQMHTTLASL